MKIAKTTGLYEAWMARHMTVVQDDLAFRHKQMASGEFPFFRATYYRWSQIWPEVCDEEAEAPSMLSVADLHLENFGTWRDLEGRLVWGVNDFDEVAKLPYTNDLIRLCASFALARDAQHLTIDESDACEAVLSGYVKSLESEGRPFVLEEDHPQLRQMATGSLRDPVAFWSRMKELPKADGPNHGELFHWAARTPQIPNRSGDPPSGTPRPLNGIPRSGSRLSISACQSSR